MPPSSVGTAFSYDRIATFSDLHLGSITALTFSPDGKYLASAADDKTVFVLDTMKLAPRFLIELEHPVYATAMIWPEIDSLFIGRSDGAVFVVLIDSVQNRVSVTEEIVAPSTAAPVQCLAYHDTAEETLIAAAYGNCVRIHRRTLEPCGNPTWSSFRGFFTGEAQSGYVTSLQFLDHHTWLLLTTHAEDGITLWNRKTATFRFHHTAIGGAYTLPDASQVFLRTLEGTIDVLRIRSSRPWFEVESKEPLSVTFDPKKNYSFAIEPLDDQVLLTGSTAGKAILLSSSTMTQHLIDHDDNEVYRIATCHTIFATGSRGESGSVVRIFSRNSTRWPATRSAATLLPAKSFHMRELHQAYVYSRHWRRTFHSFVVSTLVRALCVLGIAILLSVWFGDVIDADPTKRRPMSTWRWIPAAIRFHFLTNFGALFHHVCFVLFAGPWDMLERVISRTSMLACLSVNSGNATLCEF